MQNSNTFQNKPEIEPTKRKKYDSKLLIIILAVVFVIGAAILWYSANNMGSNNDEGVGIEQETKDSLKSKIEDLKLGQYEDSTQALPKESGANETSTTSSTGKTIDKNSGFVVRIKVYGADFNSSNSSTKSYVASNDVSAFDINKSYEEVNVYTTDFTKNYISQNGKILNYSYIDNTGDVLYYGQKYAAKILYDKSEFSLNEYFSPNVWVLELLENDPNTKDLGEKTLLGKTYRYFELKQTDAYLKNGQVIPTTLKAYLNSDLSVYRVEVVDSSNNIVALTETIQEQNMAKSEIESEYRNTKELANITIKEVVYSTEINYPSFENEITRFDIVYAKESTLLGLVNPDVEDNVEYNKLFLDPDFITQGDNYTGLAIAKYNLGYYQSKFEYRIYNDKSKFSLSDFGELLSSKEVDIKIDTNNLKSKVVSIKVNTEEGGVGTGSKEPSADSKSTTSSSESSEMTYVTEYLQYFEYDSKMYVVISYEASDNFPTEFVTLTKQKAIEFDDARKSTESGAPESEGGI